MNVKNTLARIKECLTGNRLVVLGIKYIPVIATILATLHVGLLLINVYDPVTITVAAVLLVVMLFLLSIRFNFCWLHKAMLCYMVAMAVCICIQKYDGFGITLKIFRLVMFVIGVVLVACIIRKLREGDGRCD